MSHGGNRSGFNSLHLGNENGRNGPLQNSPGGFPNNSVLMSPSVN